MRERGYSMATLAAQSAPVQSRFLDLKALTSLSHLRFATRRQIEGAYSGRHRSRQKGGAGEFADYREYVEGEDLRRLDWKVLARTGRAYTKIFQDETNLLCTLAIDASGSMDFRGLAPNAGSKLEYVQYLSTALSHMIVTQQDQVGVAVLADGLQEVIPPAGTSLHLARLHELIAGINTKPATRLGDGLLDLFSRLTRRGVLLVLSDFLVDNLEEPFAALRLFRHRRWEVVVLHIVHPEEERLPSALACRFEGLENDGRVDASPAEVARLYEARFNEHVTALRELALATGCEYHRVSTAIPYLQTLGSFLVERTG